MTDDRKRMGSLSKTRYRNLKQYKEMSDPEFDTMWDQMNQGIKVDASFEKRIQHKMNEFSDDYDVDDLKINDKLTLRALAQAYITLEDYEAYSYNVRQPGISLDRMIEIEKMNSIMSSLRKDISSMQTDLNITRKVRKGDKEQSVISELERLKSKAKEFYRERMLYIYCPECKMLLFTGWFHYSTEKSNKIQLVCKRILDSGEYCNTKIQVNINDLLEEKRGINIDDVPEAMK